MADELDVDAIRARWAPRSPGPMAHAYASADVAALLAEVERLRSEVKAAYLAVKKHKSRASLAVIALRGDERHVPDILVDALNQETT